MIKKEDTKEMRNRIKTMAVWGLLFVAVLFCSALLGIASTGNGAAAVGLGFMPMGLAGIVGINWEKGLREAKEKGKDVKTIKEEIVAAFSQVIGNQARQPLRTEKMRGADPNLAATIPIVEVVSDAGVVGQADRGYELIFPEVNMRTVRSSSFKVLDIVGGITFYQQKPGQEAKLSKLGTTSAASVEMLRFTGGLAILDDWIRNNEIYLIDDLFQDADLGWWDKKAQLFYGLLIALDASINVAFDTDISTTINNACASILGDMKNMKTPGPKRFVITCREIDRFKIAKALAAAFINANTNLNEIVYSIQAVNPTTYISEAAFYVSLPGGKNKRGEWEDFNARPAQRNEMVLGADQVWTGAYNGIIGNKKQHRRCALSA
jgi:hypothetical protein